MVFKRTALPKHLAFFWGSEMKTVRGDAHCQRLNQKGLFLAFVFLLGWVAQGFLLPGGHVGHEVHHPVALTIIIVMPGSELYEVVTESNASPSIKGERAGATV